MKRYYPILLAIVLVSCVPGVAEYTKTEAPAQLHLYGGQRVLTLGFAPGSARLSASQAGRLARLVHNGDIRPADRVEISAAGGDNLAQARVAAIARELLRYGIVTDGRKLAGVPPNSAFLLIGRYAVMLPSCPNWSNSSATDFTNEPSSNFGCADATNLGMIVANPADLAGGGLLGPASGKTAVTAVQRYLTDQVTPLAITDVGPISSTSGGGASPGGSTPSMTTDTVP